ncbi:hypothetical protein F2Q69_00031407 [Brassica cretica]|uniref:Uncharacterized protein n=1 Tax=Brassica cretica TaxID=69181 RepID=A0A8S9S1S0_BRACR|nr:hypothetical protein F2Q69_00031407 [Brassica cretica]
MIQPQPAVLSCAFHAASVKRVEAVVDGFSGLVVLLPVRFHICWGLINWASCHSLASLMEMQMTSFESRVLFSKTRWFLAVHMHQHTQEKMFPDTPVGGRHTRSCDAVKAWSKVVFTPMASGRMIGRFSQICLANLQCRNKCSADS